MDKYHVDYYEVTTEDGAHVCYVAETTEGKAAFVFPCGRIEVVDVSDRWEAFTTFVNRVASYRVGAGVSA